ncbi:MAG: choice-of-anchor J domain-containing protein [Lentimicrobium sp.]
MMKKFFTLLAFVAISFSSMAQWLPQASGFTTPSRGIQYMHAVSDQVVWASAYDGSGGGATINEFTRTTNGGELWTPGEVLGGTAYGLGNICALDGNIAYVAVYKGTGNQDNTCGVYKTVNGGLTWTHLTGALQGSASFANNVYFWNEQEGMCHGDVRDGYFEIYTTVNGGTTWQRVPQTNITGGTPASGEGGWTSVIETTGENTIMFGTNKGKVYISDDRGFTWRVTNTGIAGATNGGINEIAFTDPDNGIAIQTVAPVSYRRTSDGGATWETFTPTGPFLTNDLSSVPGTTETYVSTGAAEGFTGISYSYDKGTTWAFFPDTEGTQFLATDWVNVTTGWCGAFNESNTVGGMFKFNGSLEEPLPPTNLQGTVTGGNDVHLTWDAPGGGGTGSTEELIYDNDGIYTGAYRYEGFTMSTHMSPQGPCQILTLKYLTTIDPGDNTFNAEVYGWDDVAGTPTTTQLYTVSATAIEEAWLEIDVTSANLMVSGDFVVGFGSINATTYLGYDAGLDNGRSWDFDPTSNTWSAYNEAYLIRAVVQYPDGSVREISAAPVMDTPRFANITKSARNTFSGSTNLNPIPAQTRGSRALLGYNVWRNGAMIASQIGDTFYDDMDLANGGYSYLVTAVYDNGESVPAGPVEIEITGGGNLTSIILDFESQEDFALTFEPWEAVDIDGSETYTITNVTFPNQGLPMAFIAFNPLTTTPAVTGMTTHGGDRLGACFASVNPPNNDWLISPQVTLGESPMLSMWVKSYTDAYGLEKYNVLVSTTDNNPSSFTQIAGPVDAPVAAWTYVEYDLAAYQGQAVYVAIQCISNDAFIFLVDDISISFFTSVNDNPIAESLKVYPNPATDVLNIQAGAEISKARLFNISGQMVYESNGNSNEMRISTSEMPVGLYMLNITTKQGTITRKVSIQ